MNINTGYFGHGWLLPAAWSQHGRGIMIVNVAGLPRVRMQSKSQLGRFPVGAVAYDLGYAGHFQPL